MSDYNRRGKWGILFLQTHWWCNRWHRWRVDIKWRQSSTVTMRWWHHNHQPRRHFMRWCGVPIMCDANWRHSSDVTMPGWCRDGHGKYFTWQWCQWHHINWNKPYQLPWLQPKLSMRVSMGGPQCHLTLKFLPSHLICSGQFDFW